MHWSPLAPGVSLYLATGHAWHTASAVAPTMLLNLPAGHGEQSVWPSISPNRPAGQAPQWFFESAASCVEKRPCSQAVHVSPPTALLQCPGAHAAQGSHLL